jgi:hypothetical protein
MFSVVGPTTVWFLGNILVTRACPAFAALDLIAAGVPIYFIWQRARKLPFADPGGVLASFKMPKR